jgi:hypothetical protein
MGMGLTVGTMELFASRDLLYTGCTLPARQGALSYDNR